ncbi:hypothetical protein V7S43_000875 [Phytophthora oleae]|uniref:HTH CENPB-type domain-containing protein n=1 Tax=Phytophthora oleae TaxID=2107226 RepID=A0ABD3GAN5_9STRA
MAKIVDRMSLQTTPTFQVAFHWLENFYESGVINFADREPLLFPGLSQVSSVGGLTVSQMSFSEGTSIWHSDGEDRAEEGKSIQHREASAPETRGSDRNDAAEANPVCTSGRNWKS